MKINWKNYRDPKTRELDLVAIYEDFALPTLCVNHLKGKDYLRRIMDTHPIVSRQAAAVALVTAEYIMSTPG